MTYRFAPGARLDLFHLVDWYNAQQSGVGDDLADEFAAVIQRILAHPRLRPSSSGTPES